MRTLGFIFLGFLGSAGLSAVISWSRSSTNAVPGEWEPVQVLTFTSDLEAGSAASTNVREVTTARRFAHAAVVTPEQWKTLAARPLTSQVQEGDVVTIQHFASLAQANATDDCVQTIAREVAVAATLATEAALESMTVVTTAAPPERKLPDGARVRVLVAAEELAAGTKIQARQLRAEEVPREFVTESWVLENEAPLVEGAMVADLMSEGDPVRWQTLTRPRSDGQVGDLIGCSMTLENLRTEVLNSRARAAASAFTPGGAP